MVFFSEAMISVFKVTKENNSFPNTTPGYWSSGGGAETVNKLQHFLEPRPENDIELHVEEIKKRENQFKKAKNEKKTYLTLTLEERKYLKSYKQ